MNIEDKFRKIFLKNATFCPRLELLVQKINRHRLEVGDRRERSPIREKRPATKRGTETTKNCDKKSLCRDMLKAQGFPIICG